MPSVSDKNDQSVQSVSASVWVLECEAASSKKICQLLQKTSYKARCFASSESLIGALSQPNAPQCIIADIGPESPPGATFIHQLKGAGYTIPVIILANESDVPSAVEAMRAGAIDFMEKPYVDRLLLKRVKQVINC